MSGFADRLKSSAALRVLAVYLGASWVVLQVVDVVKQNMGLPDWVFPFALVLLVIGLPVMLATAVLQARPSREGVAVGVSHAKAAPADRSPRSLFTWRNALLGGAAALVLLAAVTTGFMFMRNRASVRSDRSWRRACSRSGPESCSRSLMPKIRYSPAR